MQTNTVLPPNQEQFIKAEALASPWRTGNCPDSFYKMTNCHEVGIQYGKTARTSIYNEDGSLWYIYSNHVYDSDFWGRNTKMGFSPFGSYGNFRDNALLTMVGESKNWYEVEINKKTRETKFISKKDPLWKKTDWNFWLAKMEFFIFEADSDGKIYDKPNGDVIGNADELNIKYFQYLGNRDSDWAYVEIRSNSTVEQVNRTGKRSFNGWIRWRDGRNILVKDNIRVFDFKTTEPNPEKYAIFK